MQREHPDCGRMRLQDAHVLPGPGPPSNMTAICHVGPPSWVKNSGSLCIYLSWEHVHTGYRLKESGSSLGLHEAGTNSYQESVFVLHKSKDRGEEVRKLGATLPTLG